MKTCTKCLQDRSLEEFHKSIDTRDGLQTRCKECQKEYQSKRFEQDPTYRRRNVMSSRYGLDENEYYDMIIEQKIAVKFVKLKNLVAVKIILT